MHSQPSQFLLRDFAYAGYTSDWQGQQKRINIPPGSVRVIEAIRFLALISATRASELPVRGPFHLYGTVAQQCVSVIAGDGGRFTRIADLCNLFEHQPQLDRAHVEGILGELASNGYLQRHGFKNQYGADEKLHQFVDYRMIYGNFGAGSDSVTVHYKSKLLGEVPAINLLRTSGGGVVRFAGKNWIVQRATRDGISVLPATAGRGAVDFVYPGKGPPTDAFVPNRMWHILHESDLPTGTLSPDLSQCVSAFQSHLRSHCSGHQIPCFSFDGGTLYFTFAGYLANKAIGLSSGRDFKADELTLWATAPIHWGNIGTNPEDYQAFYPALFEVSSDLSLYQSLLPADLQLTEFLQVWRRTKQSRLSCGGFGIPCQLSLIERLPMEVAIECLTVCGWKILRALDSAPCFQFFQVFLHCFRFDECRRPEAFLSGQALPQGSGTALYGG